MCRYHSGFESTLYVVVSTETAAATHLPGVVRWHAAPCIRFPVSCWGTVCRLLDAVERADSLACTSEATTEGSGMTQDGYCAGPSSFFCLPWVSVLWMNGRTPIVGLGFNKPYTTINNERNTYLLLQWLHGPAYPAPHHP